MNNILLLSYVCLNNFALLSFGDEGNVISSCFAAMNDVTSTANGQSAMQTTDFATLMSGSPLISQQTQPASDSGVASNPSTPDAVTPNPCYRLSDLGLDVSSSSDDDEPAQRTKFQRERGTPKAPRSTVVRLPLSVVGEVVLSDSSSANRSSELSSAPSTPLADSLPAVAKSPEPTAKSDCGRCSGEHFGRHSRTCLKQGAYSEYVVCPRCQSAHTTKVQWRNHMRHCRRSCLNGAAFPDVQWDKILQKAVKPVTLSKCTACEHWRTVHERMLHLHFVLCTSSTDKGYIPDLPDAQSLHAHDMDHELMLPFGLAESLSFAFKLRPHLMSSDYGYLHTAAHKVLCLLPRNDVGQLPTARPVTHDFDVTYVPPSPPAPPVPPPTSAPPPPPSPPSPPSAFSQYRERNPASRRLRPADARDMPRPRASVGPVSTVGGEIKVPASRGAGLVSKEAMIHCFPPTTEIHRGRKRERLVDDLHRRATQAGESPRWCSPAQLPAKIAATEDDVNAFKPTAQHPRPPQPYRDRFKILRSDGRWTDAYGRSTSPSAAKKRMPKPEVTLVGLATSQLMFSQPVHVSVSGHLPTGWGRFVLSDAMSANAAYKTTPGDDTPIPAAAQNMSYSVRLFFADCCTESAGMLLTDVRLEDHSCLQYKAADVVSVFRMRPYAPLDGAPDNAAK